MVTITGDDSFFTTVDSGLTRTQWEAAIEQAIDLINGYARQDVLPNMTGTAGSKEVSVSSLEAGFIRDVAVKVYAQDYKSAGATSSSVGIAGLSVSQSSSASSSSGGITVAHAAAREAGMALREIEAELG